MFRDQSDFTGSFDGTVRLWDSRKGTNVLGMPGAVGKVWAIGFSPDGQQLRWAGESGTLNLMYAATPAEVARQQWR